MGQWRGETFKEYASEQPSSFLEGMSASMSTTFSFVNVEGGVWIDVTDAMINLAYDPPGGRLRVK